MIKIPDARATQAQNRQAAACIEMTLASSFVAVCAAMVANAGGHFIRFKPFISAAKRLLAGGAFGQGALCPPLPNPIQPPLIQQKIWKLWHVGLNGISANSIN